jgi:hypothetical protein
MQILQSSTPAASLQTTWQSSIPAQGPSGGATVVEVSGSLVVVGATVVVVG